MEPTSPPRAAPSPARTTWRDQPPVDPTVRRAFLDTQRWAQAERFDTRYAQTYDRDWGAISATHEAFVRRLLELTRPRGTLLDAACGTGKYWEIVLASGRTLVGVDQSAGMLRQAVTNHPAVPVARMALQELRFDSLFDAVMCVDALEDIGPEDWPTVLGRLRAAVRPGAFLYLTVELLDEEQARREYEAARAAGEPVVPGESLLGEAGAGYHYFPEGSVVDRWLADARLERVATREGDDYRHYLLQRPVDG